MNDDQPAINGDGNTTPPAAPTGEGTTPQGEPQVPPTGGDGQPSPTGEGSDGKPQGGDKPPRAEVRIRELARKVKEVAHAQPTGGTTPPSTTPSPGTTPGGLPWQPNTPDISPDVNGEVDVDQLNQAVTQRASAIAELKVSQILEQKERAEGYRRGVREWADDMEKTATENPELNPDSPEYNPELDSALKDLIAQSNFTPDGFLVPKVKASELFGRLKKALDSAKEKGQSQTAASLARQISEQAVTPGGGTQPKTTYTHEELRKMMQKDPAKVAAILEKTLPVAED